MPELSNLLRQRLGAQNNAETSGAHVHPDADTLTAFAERLLAAEERQQVLTHLSTCGDCREILALSQGEIAAPEMQPVLTPAPVPLWRKLFSPTFGVAGLLAAMALIAVLVLQVPHRSGQQNQEAKTKAAPTPLLDQKAAAQPAPAAPVQPEAARSFSDTETDGAIRDKGRDLRSAAAPVAGLAAMAKAAPPLPSKIASVKQPGLTQVQPVLTAGLKKQDFINNAFFETGNGDVVVGGYEYPSAPRPQPAAADARFAVNTAVPNFSDIPPNATGNKSSMALLTPPPPTDHFGLRLDKLVTKGVRSVLHSSSSAPAIRSNSLGTSAMSLAPRFADAQKAEPGAVAAAPEKSETAELAASGAFSAASRRSLNSAETTAATWKVTDGKLLKAFGQSQWEEARTPAAFQFTTVSAHGGEVWAGGANAGLIHSYDGGNTWNLVKLGDAASGGIVSILFAGNHVQVKTSDDQSWSSADGGKSWTQN